MQSACNHPKHTFKNQLLAGNGASIQRKSCNPGPKSGRPHSPVLLQTHSSSMMALNGQKPTTITTNSVARTVQSDPGRRILREISGNRQQPSQRRPKKSRTASLVPHTDPQSTNDLWKLVMSSIPKPNKSSRRPRGRKAAHEQTDGGEPLDSISTRTPSLVSVPSTTQQTSAKITDIHFRQTVLEPRGITIDIYTDDVTPFHHFGTECPSTPGPVGYIQLEGCGDSRVWLDGTEVFVKDVIREYAYMDKERLCEAEFASYAMENLLRRDSRDLGVKKGRQWKTERMIELVAKPGDRWWIEPPVVDSSIPSRTFSFDVRPDCAYWLSAQAFNPNYLQRFKKYVYTQRNRITCPYFTVEFKRDNISDDRAANQVAAAGTLALYNRCLLKLQRLKASGKNWTKKHVDGLRHYGLTLAGDNYSFWCIRPKLPPLTSNPNSCRGRSPQQAQDLIADPSSRSSKSTLTLASTNANLAATSTSFSIPPDEWTWHGAEMVQVAQGQFQTEECIAIFVDWINEIHRWGLTVHGPACEKDVKFCLDRNPFGLRTSLGPMETEDSDAERGAGGLDRVTSSTEGDSGSR